MVVTEQKSRARRRLTETVSEPDSDTMRMTAVEARDGPVFGTFSRAVAPARG